MRLRGQWLLRTARICSLVLVSGNAALVLNGLGAAAAAIGRALDPSLAALAVS